MTATRARFRLPRPLVRVIAMFLFIALLGAVGYGFLEGWPFLDALYMTIITLSTVGFGEVRPLSPGGRLFTIALILVGVSGGVYLFSSVAEYIVAGELEGTLRRRRMEKRIQGLRDHFIVCGFGRVGQQVAAELSESGHAVVIIDSNPEAIQRAEGAGHLYVAGNAAEDEVLEAAGVARARGLVACVDSDAENVYIVLSARALRPDLIIVARANTEDSERKLRKAGATHVISPYSIAGRRMAAMLVRPNVVQFLDVVMHSAELQLFLEEIPVSESSPLAGKTVGEANIRQQTGANVLAVKGYRGKLFRELSPDFRFAPDDILIALGTHDQLNQLRRLAQPDLP
ncbi:MAG: potassium channel protein [Anaerolineae bacterium]